jgi:hypothetical protein
MTAVGANFKDALESFDGAQAAFAQGRFSDALNGFRRAAEQGHPVAPWALGTMYALGLGEARDDDLARYWYDRCADWGHSYGDDVSRQRKAEGIAIPDDEVVAWLVRAADHHAEAQYHLGRMYANAWGVARDFGACMACTERPRNKAIQAPCALLRGCISPVRAFRAAKPKGACGRKEPIRRRGHKDRHKSMAVMANSLGRETQGLLRHALSVRVQSSNGGGMEVKYTSTLFTFTTSGARP